MPPRFSRFMLSAHPVGYCRLPKIASGPRGMSYHTARPGLQWKDINFETGMVTIQRALLWKRDGTWYFGEPKTSKSRGSIPLPTSLMLALKEHKRKQAEERLKAGPEYHSLNLVFANVEGGPLMRHNLIVRRGGSLQATVSEIAGRRWIIVRKRVSALKANQGFTGVDGKLLYFSNRGGYSTAAPSDEWPSNITFGFTAIHQP